MVSLTQKLTIANCYILVFSQSGNFMKYALRWCELYLSKENIKIIIINKKFSPITYWGFFYKNFCWWSKQKTIAYYFFLHSGLKPRRKMLKLATCWEDILMKMNQIKIFVKSYIRSATRQKQDSIKWPLNGPILLQNKEMIENHQEEERRARKIKLKLMKK